MISATTRIHSENDISYNPYMELELYHLQPLYEVRMISAITLISSENDISHNPYIEWDDIIYNPYMAMELELYQLQPLYGVRMISASTFVWSENDNELTSKKGSL